ncbi:hypothetical protein [Thiocystis violacea]|uniref:hypothetical protein n=1 Tax=Thiocystis violacea TaxID=13725 RepID=UPI001908273C|nr:hypothetical protein [Thiocystis violacea]
MDAEDVAIVLIGDFNPMIFQPAWFALEGLIRKSEAEDAHVEIIHHDIASFRLDWLSVDVLPDRFTARIRSEAFRTQLRDLVVGAFSKLPHTPTRQLGINLTQRYRFATDAEWHKFGHYLAPKSPWSHLLENPGMLGLHVKGTRPDQEPGHVVVSVEPIRPGFASLRVNDHFEQATDTDQDHPTATPRFVEQIAADFEASLQRADQIIDGLLTGFMAQQDFDDGTHD